MTTFTVPAIALAGAVAVMEVALFTVKYADVPPKVTKVAPVKPVPVILTEVPPANGPGYRTEAGVCRD